MAMSYKDREKRIKASEAALEKLKTEHSEATRKRETKKLVLMGRLVEQWIEWGKIDEREFMRSMDKFLTRNYERELFGLEKLPEDNQLKKNHQPAIKDTRPIQMTSVKEAHTEKPDVAKTAITGRKLAEVSIKPEDFLQ